MHDQIFKNTASLRAQFTRTGDTYTWRGMTVQEIVMYGTGNCPMPTKDEFLSSSYWEKKLNLQIPEKKNKKVGVESFTINRMDHYKPLAGRTGKNTGSETCTKS